MLGNTSCTRRLTFCAGHRVKRHESKCAHLHGHNYVVHLTAIPMKSLDGIGRVVDFSVLKSAFDTFIQREWDHGMLLHCDDEAAISGVMAFDTESHDLRDAPAEPLDYDYLYSVSKSTYARERDGASFYGRALLNTETGMPLKQKLFLLPYNPTAENIARFLMDYSGALLKDHPNIRIKQVTVEETENCLATYS